MNLTSSGHKSHDPSLSPFYAACLSLCQEPKAMNGRLASLRREYTLQSITKRDVDPDPVAQFEKWFGEASHAEIEDVNAMTLSTADKNGRPSGRIVLLKGIEKGRFIFYTNYTSQKGLELEENPFAALTFYWQGLERQVRIQGSVEKTDPETSEKYFSSRPRKSRIGAWVSHQSHPIPSRMYLMRKFVNRSVQLMGGKVPLPSFWGGYALLPDRFEFWQGRANRLHDRINYRRQNGQWLIERLAP